jgi:Flp pilus assembly protein CpaB
MKKNHIFLLILLLAGLLGLIVWQTKAQTAKAESNETLDKYTRLILSLQNSGQTNTANEVAGVISAMELKKNEADTATLVVVLKQLRSGQTNDALNMLEIKLDGALVGMGFSETNDRDASFQNILKMAKNYRDKFPREEKNPDSKSAIEQTFSQLQK